MKEQIKASSFDVADAVIAKAYPDIYGKGRGWWGATKIPNWGILRGAIAAAVKNSSNTEDALKARITKLENENDKLVAINIKYAKRDTVFVDVADFYKE